jgi:probable Rubsico expression protein CbbX
MRITQGTFSYLPDLSDEQIEAQLRYALRQGWAISVEHTDDPHPRNALWEMWSPPQFDLIEDDIGSLMSDIRGARAAWPHGYVKVVCYDRSLGRQTTALAFVVGRPPVEPGFAVQRQEKADRQIRYTIHAYATDALRTPVRSAWHSDGQRRARLVSATLLDAPVAADIEAVLAQMDAELVALEPVKTRIREIAALLVIDRLRRQEGLVSSRPSLHMSFTGNPGTGKTTVALRMAEVLHRLGYVEKPEVVSVTRDDLVGQYVGHTAPKTREVLKRARGGVLFIDEAYYLYRPENERDYGQEAIEILLQVMETERDTLVVVLAGYRDRMETFFTSNPGMSSRIAHHIHFPDFDVDELMAIADLMLDREAYELTPAAREALRAYVERRVQRPRFAHGRSIRNAIERARMRQASRLYDLRDALGRADLMTIDAADILASSVFAEEGDMRAVGAGHTAAGNVS